MLNNWCNEFIFCKIKNISILENKAVAGAKVYVGVYDIDSLVTVDIFDAARDKGAIPVLVTSIYRRRFSDGVSEDTQCGYPEEMKAYAQTVNVPVIDLHQKTGAWLTQIGETESAKYYMTHAGDNTHLTYNGVVELNRMAKEEMVKLGLPLNTYFAQNQ